MIKNTYTTFGEYVKDNRKEKGLTAVYVGNAIGVSKAEISRIESGDRKEPSIKIVRFISALFGDDFKKVVDTFLTPEDKERLQKIKKH